MFGLNDYLVPRYVHTLVIVVIYLMNNVLNIASDVCNCSH